MGSNGNYYRILDVPYDATFNEIKEAYRKKVKEVHPDTEKGNEEQFKRVKEAYETLKNVGKRKRYDDLLFKKAHNGTDNLKQEASAQTNSYINIIKIRSKKRKHVSFSPLIIDVAFILIGALANTYLNKKK
ncbi:DnaJ domain-containing protein [Neobacillus cucumis]|uniref:J domain-containing protein n=1 Tax=Neobacillus cucumis TaxID=1740721 RepID=UPI0018DEF20A|nr:DnaJ domain-containing protein [Neobacillus cucumis]MBI0580086.1 DnaJ domain-containing protein [Neobacillus cucumis]